MHLNDEQIQRALHGELDTASRAALERHLAECPPCARAFADAGRDEQAVFDLLGHLDHAPRPLDLGAVVAPARSRAAVWIRRAAAFAVVAALGGAAYAIPGSPLPAMLGRAAHWITGRTSPEPAPGTAERVTSGISVTPGPRFTIHFTDEQSTGVLEVTLTDRDQVVVRVLGGAATFTSDADRLTVENRGSAADYEIEVPAASPWIEITVGGRRRLLKQGDRLFTDGPADTQGRYVLPMIAPAARE